MRIITDFVRDIQIVAAVVILVLFAAAGLGIVWIKSRSRAVKEKNIDYSDFEKRDSMAYIRIDDVAEDMLVTDGGRRFIGAIKCQGFSFAEAEEAEKLQTIRGYITFFNVLDNNPIQYRQSARDVDLSRMIRDYQEQADKLSERMFLLNLDYTEWKAESENAGLSEDDYLIYYEKLKRMQRELVSLDCQVGQLKAQIQYMEAVSGENAEAQREELYVFDWQYNAVDFSSQSLDEQEVYLRAGEQLKAKASAYILALRNCGVHARRATGAELLEEIRRYTHPVSAARGTVEDIVQSAYDCICVTSGSLREMEESVNRKMLEEIGEEIRQEGGHRKHA